MLICSYNCEGITRRADYINEFLCKSKCDILCLQETWLIDQTLFKLGCIHDDYLFTGMAGVDSTVYPTWQISRGRRYFVQQIVGGTC